MHLQWADIAIEFAGSVRAQVIFSDPASRGEKLARWTGVNVAHLVIGEILAREDAGFAFSHVDDRNVRRYLLVIDEPIKGRRRAIGRIGRKPFGLDIKALFRSLDHRLRGTDLRLANGTRSFDIHDDAALQVDQIVVGIGEEGRSPHCARPLRGWIRWRDELRPNLACCTKGRVIEGCKILLHGAARRLGIACLLPFRAWDRALLVGVSLDQAGIHGKSLSANEIGRNTRPDHTLKYPAKDVAVAETLIACSRERRMIRDLVLYAELAEPAIGEVHLQLATQQPLGTQAKDIADDQHPDHQHRINRGPAERWIVRREFCVDPR